MFLTSFKHSLISMTAMPVCSPHFRRFFQRYLNLLDGDLEEPDDMSIAESVVAVRSGSGNS